MIISMETRWNTKIWKVRCDRMRCGSTTILTGTIEQSGRQVMEAAGWQMGTPKDPCRDICKQCKDKGLR